MQRAASSLQRAALSAGVVASFYYAAITAWVATRWPGYSSLNQTVSELSAVNAPTRAPWLALASLYTLLSLWFALGVIRAAEDGHPLRMIGSLLLIYASLGLVWPFAPMHLRETIAAAGPAATDALHILLTTLTVASMLGAVGLGIRLFGAGFRVYSGLTLVVVLVAGALTGRAIQAISSNRPTPLVGLWERVCIGAFLLWLAVLAIRLVRASDE